MLECGENIAAVKEEQLTIQKVGFFVLSGVLGQLSDNWSEGTSGSRLSVSAVAQTSPAASSLPREQLQKSGDYENHNLTTTKTYHNKTLMIKNEVLCFLSYISNYFARNGFKNLQIYPDVAG